MPFSKKCYIVDEPPGSTSEIPTSGYKEHEIELPSEEILNSDMKILHLLIWKHRN